MVTFCRMLVWFAGLMRVISLPCHRIWMGCLVALTLGFGLVLGWVLVLGVPGSFPWVPLSFWTFSGCLGVLYGIIARKIQQVIP